MTTLYAQPYDITATGFYFEGAEDYAAKAAKALNSSGELVEEFESSSLTATGWTRRCSRTWCASGGYCRLP